MLAVKQAAKAVVAFFLPGISLLVAAWQNGSLSGANITHREVVQTLITAVVTSVGVYVTRNAASTDPTTSTPDVAVSRGSLLTD
jgi:hypothetical protein